MKNGGCRCRAALDRHELEDADWRTRTGGRGRNGSDALRGALLRKFPSSRSAAACHQARQPRPPDDFSDEMIAVTLVLSMCYGLESFKSSSTRRI